MRASPPTRQGLEDLRVQNALEPRREVSCARVRGAGRGDLQIVEINDARILRPIPDEEPGFEAHEGNRAIRSHGAAQGHAAVAMQTRGHIQREDRTAGGIDGLDDVGQLAAHIVPQPGAEQRVDDDFTFAEERGGERADAPAAGNEIVMSEARVALQGIFRRGGQHGNRQTRGLREARKNVPVAPVVSAPAHDDDAIARGPARTEVAQGGFTGALHQRVTGHP